MNTNAVKPVRFGDEIEIEISSLAFGGDAVGRYQDFAIFVSGVLPGERVKIRVTQVKDHYASGELLAVLRHSTDRVAPVCPIFEECGGCQWQHLSYPRQLQTKRQFVLDAIQRIGRLPNVAVQPCLPSPQPYAYRNKAMPVLSIRDGHFVSGIYEPRSHRLVPYNSCPIQGDAINELIQKVLKKIDRSGLTPYQEKTHSGFLRHLAVRRGEKTGEMLLAFVTRTEAPEERLQKPTLFPEELDQILPRLARELMDENSGLVGVLQNINASRTNVVFGTSTRLLAGRDHYFEAIDDLKLKVSLKSFLQVNTQQAGLLHAVVREALGDPVHKKKWGTILDLYSGIGTLAMAVSEKADYVVGVEEVGAAVEDARFNAEANQRANIDFLEGDVDKILMGLKDKGLTQIDAVLLDPPRKGVLPEVLARITALHPERLVYVSCDPSTLARDLSLLVKHGFAVDWVQPLDMFPQTYHVETVVKLTRETPLPSELLSQTSETQLEPFRLPKETRSVSLNVSANFSALMEKTATLFQAVAQWGSVVFDLARSAFFALGRGLAVGPRLLAKVMVFLFHGLRNFVIQFGAHFKALILWMLNLFGRLIRGTRRVFQSLFFFGKEKSLWLKEKAAFSLKRSPQEKTEIFPVTPPTSPSVPTTEVLAIEKAAEFMAPVASSVESAPIEKEQVPPVFSLPEPVVRPGSFRNLLTLKIPSLPVEEIRVWFQTHKTIRWAFMAAFLVSGGLVAKATLAPLLKKSSLLVPTVSQMIPDVIAVMPTRNFLRYEMVPFEVRVNSGDMPYFSEMKATAEVFRSGEPVSMVGGKSKLYLKKDTSAGKFIGNWPIPYNPPPGTYIAEVVLSSPQWPAPKTFESAFTISPLKPRGLFPGYAALTMEGGKQLQNGGIPALDGSDSLKAANAIDWAKFMGANLYCYLIGQTSIWDHLIARDFPFNPGDYEVGLKYARASHEAGLKFAAYLTTFKVVGDAWNQAPYQFSTGYDLDTDELIQTRFISLNDSKRRQDLIDMLKKLNEEESVDIVGLDYVRTGFAGYEMVDEFVRDLNVPGPIKYWSMSKQERIHWLAKTVELREDPQVVSLFEWWRAHKVALALKSILDEAKMTKPVFTFTLGWQMGHQHGQDPAMFIDAGVNFNHIMLYEGDRGTIESMKRQWPDYLSRGNGMYAMGEMVDFNMVQKSIDPPGPEELYNREVDTFHNWFPMNAGVGMFWHDLYRMVYGIRGPYSTMEWLIAGGKAFTTLHQAQGLSPIEVALFAPKQVPAGVPVPISVEIHNHSPEDLKGVVLHQLDTTKDYYTDLATVGPFDLPAGNMVRVKSLYVNIPREEHPERDNRYMAAVMVEKPGESLRAFDFMYLKKISNAAVLSHMDALPSSSETDDSSSKDSAPAQKENDR
jgi:23S rRNA (uracil1939-C5)-methyltransferase